MAVVHHACLTQTLTDLKPHRINFFTRFQSESESEKRLAFIFDSSPDIDLTTPTPFKISWFEDTP